LSRIAQYAAQVTGHEALGVKSVLKSLRISHVSSLWKNRVPVRAGGGGRASDVCYRTLAAFLKKGGVIKRVYGTHVSVVDALRELGANVESGAAVHVWNS